MKNHRRNNTRDSEKKMVAAILIKKRFDFGSTQLALSNKAQELDKKYYHEKTCEIEKIVAGTAKISFRNRISLPVKGILDPDQP